MGVLLDTFPIPYELLNAISYPHSMIFLNSVKMLSGKFGRILEMELFDVNVSINANVLVTGYTRRV